MYIATGTQDGDSPMTMFENWPYALMGISSSRGLLWVKINDLGDSKCYKNAPVFDSGRFWAFLEKSSFVEK